MWFFNDLIWFENFIQITSFCFAKKLGFPKIVYNFKSPCLISDDRSSGQTQTLYLGILRWRFYHTATDPVQRFLKLEKVWAFRGFFIGMHRVCRMSENNKYIFPAGFASWRGLNKDPTFWEISPTLKHPVPPPDASSSGQTQTLGLGILKWRLYHCANDKVQIYLILGLSF
jgi:hypothetical protein